MTDQVLNILKFVLLGLLYLFFARVLWAVWSEVRAPVGRQLVGNRRQAAAQPGVSSSSAATAPITRPGAATGAGEKQSRRSTKGKGGRSTKGKGGRAARLVVLEPASRRGLTVAIDGEITLGREPGCTIVIDDDAYVSQLHFRIFDYDGQPMVEDLGSTNGTYHNGVRLVGARLLRRGDRIQVGTTLIEAQ